MVGYALKIRETRGRLCLRELKKKGQKWQTMSPRTLKKVKVKMVDHVSSDFEKKNDQYGSL